MLFGRFSLKRRVILYDFQPYWVKELSTLESGLAKNNDVDVKEGDKVMDAAGNRAVVEIAPPAIDQ